MRSSVRVYPSDTALPSAFSSAFAAVDEPGAEGGVGIVPGTFFIFLRGADIVHCGAGRTQTMRSKTTRFIRSYEQRGFIDSAIMYVKWGPLMSNDGRKYCFERFEHCVCALVLSVSDELG